MMIKLVDSSPAVTADELGDIEASLGVSFPDILTSLWLISNGGKLEDGRRVYQSEKYENDIKYFLSILRANSPGLLTADGYYRTLVVDKKILPANFLPFAIDGCGFPYCMNLDDGAVYFANLESQKNIFLEQSLESFISKVITEDEAWGF